MVKNAGYSLIELLTVMTVGTILVGIGLFNLNVLNRRQVLVQSTKKLVADLRQTKSLADAQQKPNGCDVLNGYSLTVTSSNTVTIKAECVNGNYDYQNKLYTAQITNVTKVFYPVLQQPAQVTSENNTNEIGISQNGQTITISISISGSIDYE